MPIPTAKITNPAVRALVTAVNAGDRTAFRAVLTPDATMSDDGTERDLDDWVEREIFSAHGRMAVEKQSADGLSLVAGFRNDMWGEMRTKWRFVVFVDRISRFETGQA
jgi:hypothetical protein